MVVSCFPLQVCKSLRLHTTTTTTITTSYHSPDTCRYIFNAYFFFFSSVFGFLVATFFFLSERKKRFSVWTFVSFRHSRGRSPSDSHRREEGKKKTLVSLRFIFILFSKRHRGPHAMTTACSSDDRIIPPPVPLHRTDEICISFA